MPKTHADASSHSNLSNLRTQWDLGLKISSTLLEDYSRPCYSTTIMATTTFIIWYAFITQDLTGLTPVYRPFARDVTSQTSFEQLKNKILQKHRAHGLTEKSHRRDYKTWIVSSDGSKDVSEGNFLIQYSCIGDKITSWFSYNSFGFSSYASQGWLKLVVLGRESRSETSVHVLNWVGRSTLRTWARNSTIPASINSWWYLSPRIREMVKNNESDLWSWESERNTGDESLWSLFGNFMSLGSWMFYSGERWRTQCVHKNGI